MNSKHDENGRTTIICASQLNGVDIVPIYANPTTHTVLVNDNMGGVDNGNNSNNATLDENNVPVFTALSSDGSGAIVEVYGDPIARMILIDSM